ALLAEAGHAAQEIAEIALTTGKDRVDARLQLALLALAEILEAAGDVAQWQRGSQGSLEQLHAVAEVAHAKVSRMPASTPCPIRSRTRLSSLSRVGLAKG